MESAGRAVKVESAARSADGSGKAGKVSLASGRSRVQAAARVPGALWRGVMAGRVRCPATEGGIRRLPVRVSVQHGNGNETARGGLDRRGWRQSVRLSYQLTCPTS